MPGKSPPKHRHDGTSPLPLGMDWSAPPTKWEGRNTLWPHDPKTGWSYCVMIPSWFVQTGSGASRDSLWSPIVFYRIQVGMQSPEGISSGHGMLRRFSEFMKLISDLKRVFPKKYFPPPPPKHALLRINSSRQLLEERRRALEEWMGKLLSDIDLSRSAHIASFLELEAAARSSFQDASQPSLETSISSNSSGDIVHRQSNSGDGSNDHVVVHELLDQEEGESSLRQMKCNNDTDGCASSRNFSEEMSLLMDRIDSASEQDHGEFSSHSRRLSSESVGRDTSSISGGDFLIPRVTSLVWDDSVDSSSGIEFPVMEALRNTESRSPYEAQFLLPLDEQHKINMVLSIMQRRLAAAKTDMEELIERLNQEILAKEYLTRKVKDLEADLYITKQRSKENLQQAILLERERLTQTQWAVDELSRKYQELKNKVKMEQIEKTSVPGQEKDSKADIKVLVKEVKFLRNSVAELKEILSKATNDKAELERTLLNEKRIGAHTESERVNLVHKCETLRRRLRECRVNFLAGAEDRLTVTLSSFPAALDLLEASDSRIDLLIAEAQSLAPDYEELSSDLKSRASESSRDEVMSINGDDQNGGEEEVKRMVVATLIDNAGLRKQLNSAFRCALKTEADEGDRAPHTTA